jgi:hypothetical protein
MIPEDNDVSPDTHLTPKECAAEVRLIAQRLALMYHFFATTLVEELGRGEGERLIQKAIEAYGVHVGTNSRAQVEALGLPPTPENASKAADLPAYGWETGMRQDENGERFPVVYSCPFAETWKELGPEAERLGRLYCWVDQAKQKGYNPDYEFLTTRNVLEGDPWCEFAVRPAGGSDAPPAD